MGRFGSDVLALSCIAGGAVIATGITAALLASPASPAPSVDSACSSQVVVRMGSAHDDAGNLKVFSTSGVCNAVRVDVAEITERMDEMRVRVDEARVRAEVARVEAEKVRRHARTAEIRVRQVNQTQVRELRLEALRRQMEALGERLEEVRETEVQTPLVEVALTEARDELLRQIEELTASLANSGGN